MKGKVIDTNFRHNTITLKCDEPVNHQQLEYVVIPIEKYKQPEMLEMLKEIANQIEDGRTYVTKDDIRELIKSATEL